LEGGGVGKARVLFSRKRGPIKAKRKKGKKGFGVRREAYPRDESIWTSLGKGGGIRKGPGGGPKLFFGTKPWDFTGRENRRWDFRRETVWNSDDLPLKVRSRSPGTVGSSDQEGEEKSGKKRGAREHQGSWRF